MGKVAMGEPADAACQSHIEVASEVSELRTILDAGDAAPQEETTPVVKQPEECHIVTIQNSEDGIGSGFSRTEGTAPGHDSGVEVAAGEYASSGAPDPLSRASSLISCGSGCDDSYEIIACNSADRLDEYKNGTAGDGTSEGGSESSSVTGGGNSGRSGAGPVRRPTTGTKKRVAVTDPNRSTRPKPTPAPRPTQGRAPNLMTRERARSRDKSSSMEKPPPPGPKPAIIPRSRLRNTPDSLSLSCREPPSLKVKATKTSSARCRTPGTPPEEPRGGRVPGTTPGSMTPRGLPAESPLGTRPRISHDSKSAFDKYATLPRRKRENSPELAMLRRETRSTSVNRDTSMNRSMTGLRRGVTRDRESPPLRSLPPYPKQKLPSKIRIYHETSIQTVLLGNDVENALAGIGIAQVRTDLVPVERSDKYVQVDNREADIERLEQRVRLLLEANANAQAHSDLQTEKLELAETRLEEERAEKMAAQQELQKNTERVLGMLGRGSHMESNPGDSLFLLESQLQTSANIVTRQQEEINKLHATCRELQKELESNHRVQRTLETHLRHVEREAAEMQDFLQAEKATMAEALKDIEGAYNRAERERVSARADCRATLRLAEQRRQEALAMRAKIAMLTRPTVMRKVDTKAPALPGLASGLKALLDSLILEHSISPEDLEDVIFHNEAFSRSASSEACSPGSPPPQPPPAARLQPCRLSDDENSADLLDSETEPCLMMESVLEDVQVLDTYSHNLVSSSFNVLSCPANVGHDNFQKPDSATGQNLEQANMQQNESRLLNVFNKEDSCSSLQNLTMFSGDELSPVIPDEKFVTEGCYQGMDIPHLDYSENDSLHNLSQAILHRQRSEAECSMSEDYTGHREQEENAKSSNYMVDQVILVDNLVNKLLKVLKIIHSKGDLQVEIPQSQTVELKSAEEAVVDDVAIKMAQLCVDKINLQHSTISENLDIEQRLQFLSDDNSCHENCQIPGEEWNSKTCEGPLCSQKCGVEEQTSPRHSLSDCNANSPQPINSAA